MECSTHRRQCKFDACQLPQWPTYHGSEEQIFYVAPHEILKKMYKNKRKAFKEGSIKSSGARGSARYAHIFI